MYSKLSVQKYLPALSWNLKYGGQGHSFLLSVYKNAKSVLDFAWCVAFSSLTTLQTLRVLVNLQIPQVVPVLCLS